MKVDNQIATDDSADRAGHDVCAGLIEKSVARLRGFVADLAPIQRALQALHLYGDAPAQKKAARMMRQLDALEPSVTMIGQIKSGKTTVVNSLIGKPNLLPADVNPWTSVVTSLHLSPVPLEPPMQARFQFFQQGEWDRLVSGGGRIGEMADRAGANEELDKIKLQIEEMREKSKARLGRKFEMLLGQTHQYGYFDAPLIERYVCLGDDFEGDVQAGDNQGRFADITKAASLYFQQPGLPMKLCVRDTPGVNDTFLMREQITIQAIRESRICVVVLSAHQALSTTDLALVRLITNVKSREIIIFVNRIDELAEPTRQVPEIRAAILEMLAQHKGPADAKIIFGSALWSQYAMMGTLPGLPEDSKAALLNWAESPEVSSTSKTDPRTILWDLSGLPALFEAIEARIIEGVGRELQSQIAIEASNALNGLILSDKTAAKSAIGKVGVHAPPHEVAQRLSAIKERSQGELAHQLATVRTSFEQRIDRAHSSFLDRATEALIVHLDRHGEDSVWNYDPSGLRILLSSSYRVFGNACHTAFGKVAQLTAKQLSDLCQEVLQLPEEVIDIKTPEPPPVPPPVSLGQTIALDMKGSWWQSWWFKRRGYQAYATQFHALIKAETDGFIDALKHEQADAMQKATVEAFHRFITDQVDTLQSVTSQTELTPDKLDALFGLDTLEQREAELRKALDLLDPYCL